MGPNNGPEGSLRDMTIDWQGWLWAFMKKCATLWHYPIVMLEREPLTIGSVALCLLLYFVGSRLIHRSRHWIQKRFIARLSVDANIKHHLDLAIHAILFGLMIVVVLDIAHVPLTVFTLVGSAVAIGFGLGSQHIVRHLISGLILMLEQSVRLGDVIKVQDYHGAVMAIGIRYTRLHTLEEGDILVPNGTFLEQPVVNYGQEDATTSLVLWVETALHLPCQEVRGLLTGWIGPLAGQKMVACELARVQDGRMVWRFLAKLERLTQEGQRKVLDQWQEALWEKSAGSWLRLYRSSSEKILPPLVTDAVAQVPSIAPSSQETP